MLESGSTTRSADECEMSRSCQSAMFSNPTMLFARTSRAMPQMRSERIGLRLCGIALDPFWPGLNFSCASRISVRCQWRTCKANFSNDEARIASVRSEEHTSELQSHHDL